MAETIPTCVIADDLRFRRKLRIGENAYTALKTKRTLQEVAGVAGAAWAGSAVAASPVIATTFFAPTGLAAFFGLATAATPIGWVVVGAALAGGAYFDITRMLGGEQAIETVPVFINSSVDELGQMLFGLIGSLAVRVALADGTFNSSERQTILANFVSEWGFDPVFAERALDALVETSQEQDLATIARAFATLTRDNPDCGAAEMQAELFELLDEVMRADGVIQVQEQAAISEICKAISGPGFNLASPFGAAEAR